MNGVSYFIGPCSIAQNFLQILSLFYSTAQIFLHPDLSLKKLDILTFLFILFKHDIFPVAGKNIFLCPVAVRKDFHVFESSLRRENLRHWSQLKFG